MKKRLIRNFFILTILTIISLIFFPFILYSKVKSKNSQLIYHNIEEIPAERVAIVFGAGIWNETTPSDVLRDRILTAVKLYKADKVQKIIMSGDNRFEDYNEPGTMIHYASEQGIPESVLQPDYAGRRTYDTCIRARDIFGVDEAILITQEFHLTRALYTCNSVGVKSIGLTADLSKYPNINYMQLRDIYALLLAAIDLKIRKPEVVLGDRIEII